MIHIKFEETKQLYRLKLVKYNGQVLRLKLESHKFQSRNQLILKNLNIYSNQAKYMYRENYYKTCNHTCDIKLV